MLSSWDNVTPVWDIANFDEGGVLARANYKAQDFIDAIPGSGGIISTIAQRVGCAWHTAKTYIADFPTVARVYQDECEKVTDLAESTIIRAIKDGDTHTAKWYLTMKGRERGYAKTERHEVGDTNGDPLQFVIVGANPENL